MMRLLALAVGLCAVAMSVQAQAQSRSERTRLANCFVQHDSDRMRRWIEADGPMLMWREMSATSLRPCRPIRNTRFEYWTLRGSIAEALLLPGMSEARAGRWSSIAPPTDVLVSVALNDEAVRNHFLTTALTECLVHRNLQGVLALFRAAPDSPAEREAFATLAPSIVDCRQYAADFAVEVPTDMLRARIAIAAYLMDLKIRPPSGATE